jgi:hypothetical protein
VASRSEGGQASVELALLLPVIALLALVLVQVGLVVRAQVLVTHASREGARAAAVSPEAAAAREAVEASLPYAPARIDVRVRGRHETGDRITVEVRLQVPTEVPLIGQLVADVPLLATTTMRVE